MRTRCRCGRAGSRRGESSTGVVKERVGHADRANRLENRIIIVGDGEGS